MSLIGSAKKLSYISWAAKVTDLNLTENQWYYLEQRIKQRIDQLCRTLGTASSGVASNRGYTHMLTEFMAISVVIRSKEQPINY